MNGIVILIVLAFASGLALVMSWNALSHPSLALRIAPYVGKPIHKDMWTKVTEYLLEHRIFSHPRSPWGSQFAVEDLLRVSGVTDGIRSFRIRQLSCIAIAFGCASGWVGLRGLVHKPIPGISVLFLLSFAILVGGWIPVWQLEQLRNKRSEDVDAVLPVFLELMAFTVGAGEPMIAAMDRVADEISGPFATEVRTMALRIHSGESLSEALKNLNKQFANVSLARAIRTLDMAMERGTPIAEVLRSQASDARASYSRSLMILAGKKETAMLLPVVFFILPMIVAVAIYPGLVALKVL